MKLFILASVAMLSLSAFAGVTCKGTKEGKNFRFVMSTSDESITSLVASVDGKVVGTYSGSTLSVTQHAYGTVVATRPTDYSLKGVLVVLGVSNMDNIANVDFYPEVYAQGISVNCK